MFNTFRLQVRQLSSRTYQLCWHVDFNECFHIFQRFELPRQLSIKEIRTQEAVVVKYTFGKPRTSADWIRDVWYCVMVQDILCNFNIFFNCCPSKKNLINDSSCRGHFWFYAHVHLDNKISSLVIHAGMKV